MRGAPRGPVTFGAPLSRPALPPITKAKPNNSMETASRKRRRDRSMPVGNLPADLLDNAIREACDDKTIPNHRGKKGPSPRIQFLDGKRDEWIRQGYSKGRAGAACGGGSGGCGGCGGRGGRCSCGTDGGGRCGGWGGRCSCGTDGGGRCCCRRHSGSGHGCCPVGQTREVRRVEKNTKTKAPRKNSMLGKYQPVESMIADRGGRQRTTTKLQIIFSIFFQHILQVSSNKMKCGGTLTAAVHKKRTRATTHLYRCHTDHVCAKHMRLVKIV